MDWKEQIFAGCAIGALFSVYLAALGMVLTIIMFGSLFHAVTTTIIVFSGFWVHLLSYRIFADIDDLNDDLKARVNALEEELAAEKNKRGLLRG